MGNRFLMARYRASEALLYQIFMQRQGLFFQNVIFLNDLALIPSDQHHYFSPSRKSWIILTISAVFPP